MDVAHTGRMPARSIVVVQAAMVLLLSWANFAGAQEGGQKTLSGFDPRLMKLPERGGRTPESLDEFVDKVSSTDAIVEVIVGQGKLLRFKKDLAPDNMEDRSPVIAASDPSVIDFEVLDRRHIRVIGLRIGVTDLSILTVEGDDYTFEIQVTADMVLLENQLGQVFPDAKIRVRQLRDHVVVDGEAPSLAMRKQIEDAIAAYLVSLQAAQATKVKYRRQITAETDTPPRTSAPGEEGEKEADPGEAGTDVNKPEEIDVTIPPPKIINLISVERYRMNDLDLNLQQHFPDALIKVEKVGTKIVLRGQARDAYQKVKIYELVEAYLKGMQGDQETNAVSGDSGSKPPTNVTNVNIATSGGTIAAPAPQYDIIDLMTVPGPQQVMLRVEIAELNRTAFRAIGFNFNVDINNNIVGFRPGGNGSGAPISVSLLDILSPGMGQSTVFGVVEDRNFAFVLDALRRNNVFKVLAEPNLVAMNGQEASFNAGGAFPVPVPQSGAGGGNPTITIQYKEFGVNLDFKPTILDEEQLQLAVSTRVSSIDESLGQLLPDFGFVPALNERRAQTTVQLKEGTTLAIAGLLQIELNGNTSRIPGLGDLPYVGPFFSNTTSEKMEKELIVLITPYIVESMKPEEVGLRPGDLVEEPTDFEFYFLNRIERRKCDPCYRATTAWHRPWHHGNEYYELERSYVVGPHGYSD